MFAARTLQRHSVKTLFSLLQSNPSKNLVFLRDVLPHPISSNVTQPTIPSEDSLLFSSHASLDPFKGWFRSMSTSKGRSMRSKVEKRMQRESGKTLREKRRAQKLKKKLMTEEERLVYNLKRAKKKVALLLQKLKKYELPELPPPRHDPELLTPEQLQAFKKIGFRNKNYVPVGVRGVFGGVVQNMHLHWKFHETVQVCCDNFPKEKIKEMATMIARLSGGIVVNIHNVKTIIMFRGRNYRQPKILIPINTLTKRKALFKARFEQALESQKLNIKKLEQQLRRMGVNPEDPVAMASIQRVASTFFNAIDRQEGSPYVFREDKLQVMEPIKNFEESEPPDDSDQEELDRFIAEIEDAADKEWVAEEEAEKEELSKIRAKNNDNSKRNPIANFRKQATEEDSDSVNTLSDTENAMWQSDVEEEPNSEASRAATYNYRSSSDEEDNLYHVMGDEKNGVNQQESDADDSDETHVRFKGSRVAQWKHNRIGRSNNDSYFETKTEAKFSGNMAEEDSGSEEMFSDLENAMWESDAEGDSSASTAGRHDYRSSGDEEDHHPMKAKDYGVDNKKSRTRKELDEAWDSD
ncbi:putative crm domain-containing protein [Quercus suber]|uniref:Crm domain-containing protein n=1 Tax=Quercus suber TaxID=58331 RepID=A0AAW0M8H6_QUESU